MIRNIFSFLLFVGLLLAFPFVFKEATQGFRLSKLTFDFPMNPKWDLPFDEQVQGIFSQTFRFLGKGAQSYVFVSEDGKYVIKFFRFDREPKKADLLFQACWLAYEKLQEETGVIYLHLNRTDSLPVLQAVDPIGRKVSICLDETRFVVQKRGIGMVEALLTARHDSALMKERLTQFLDLLTARSSKGVWNKDPSLVRNFGFFENRAFEIDFGSYRERPNLNPEAEVRRYAKKMRRWLSKNSPESVPLFDELCQFRKIDEWSGAVPGKKPI